MSDEDVFDALTASLDTPMLIVTAYAHGERSGCLVGFASQVSIRPKRFLVMLSKENHTYGVATDAALLGIHVLRSSDHEIAAHFGELTGDDVDKFAGIGVVEGPGRMPVIAGLDWFAGRVLRQIDLGDHVGFLLAPHDGSAARSDEPQLGLRAVSDLDAGHDA